MGDAPHHGRKLSAAFKSQTLVSSNQLPLPRRPRPTRCSLLTRPCLGSAPQVDDAAKGMLFLHSQTPPVLHRDLKPDNVLVDDGFRVVIADLNLAGVAEPGGRGAAGSGSACGNPHWIAPELMAPRARATKESDVFAFSYLLWAVLTWRHPWRGVPECAVRRPARLWPERRAPPAERERLVPTASPATPVPQVQATVCRGGRPTVPSAEELPGPAPLSPNTVPAFIALMEACWAQAPEERPSFVAIEDSLRCVGRSASHSTDHHQHCSLLPLR